MSRGSVPTSDSAIASAEIYVQIKRAVGNVQTTLAKMKSLSPTGAAWRKASPHPDIQHLCQADPGKAWAPAPEKATALDMPELADV